MTAQSVNNNPPQNAKCQIPNMYIACLGSMYIFTVSFVELCKSLVIPPCILADKKSSKFTYSKPNYLYARKIYHPFYLFCIVKEG